MSSKSMKVLLGILMGLFLSSCLFTFGVFAGAAIPSLIRGSDSLLSRAITANFPSLYVPSQTGASSGDEAIDELFIPFWESWDIVHDQFIDQPVDDEALMQGAIQGMLESLGDEHTTYINPEQYEQANTLLTGEYEGIGVWVDPTSEYLTVISTMPDSPAEEVGLLPGDEVIAVDGEDMTGIDASLVIRRILGPAGTNVHLSIRREGEAELLEFDMIRAKITVPTVESEMLDDNIAYVRIYDFGGRTTEHLREALMELLSQNPEGLILDLRGNPGGLLTTSVEVASEFLPDGVVLIEKYGDGQEQVFEVQEGGLATEIPLVVLVNAGSASASEIVAAAIQDVERGIVVGETTFGKGSVQSWVELSNDAGAIRVTVAKWYTPNERLIEEIGLTPDFEIPLSEEEFEQGEDPQLDKAIELLLGTD